MTVALAAPNEPAADAGARIAAQGGNAVDVAVATVVAATVTDHGICSLAGGAYLTVADGAVTEVIDANVVMPGRGLDPLPRGSGVFDLHTEYGGGVDMQVGHGSVATPGTPMGLALAHQRHGRMPWRAVWEPARQLAAEGFETGSASLYYLRYVHDTLFGWHEPSRRALHDEDGTFIADRRLVIEHLADTLGAIAQGGIEEFTHGDVARLIVDDVQANDGLLTMQDLAAYQPVVRAPLQTEVTTATGRWRIATNPPPAIGGVTLSAMLNLLVAGGRLPRVWDAPMLRRMVALQDIVLSRRVTDLDTANDREAAGRALLELVASDDFDAGMASPSTLHVSAVDDEGLACAITTSAGYGSGVMPPGTGVWLNNCLGEVELNPHGLHGWQPGERLPSNMAPSVVIGPRGEQLAIGSPGADRITTALLQVLARFFAGVDLQEAVAAPRLHVRHHRDGSLRDVAHEEDLDLGAAWDGPREPMHPNAMFFGGVGAVLARPDGTLRAAGDPRRTGGVRVV